MILEFAKIGVKDSRVKAGFFLPFFQSHFLSVQEMAGETRRVLQGLFLRKTLQHCCYDDCGEFDRRFQATGHCRLRARRGP